MALQTKRSQSFKQYKQTLSDLEQQGYVPLPVSSNSNMGESNNRLGSINHFLAATYSVTDGMFAQSSESIEIVAGEGTQGLGFVKWGSDNLIPNKIASVVANLPYTAAGVKFNVDTVASNGPRMMYRTRRYVAGTLQTEHIPYEDAYTYIEGRIEDLLLKIEDETVKPKRKKHLEAQLKELESDLANWKRTMPEYQAFLNANNLDLTFKKLTQDQEHTDICFPMVEFNQGDGKSKGSKGKKIVKISHRSILCTRLEQMDKYGIINNVYYSNKWRGEDSIDAKGRETNAITSYPALNPETAIRDLIDIRDGIIKSNKEKFVIPSCYPSIGSAYYPTPAFWSVFNSRIYNYASTLISDKATIKDNSNMWGKIVYIHEQYLQSAISTAKATTLEEKEAVLSRLWNEIDNFLKNKANNGKTLMSFSGSKGEKEYKAFEIVDVPQSTHSRDLKAELEEIASIIFFALEVHPQLIGAIPGGSSSGTYQRELYLLKQVKTSPRRSPFLFVLKLVNQVNGWDQNAVWTIPDMVLTTLDASKTGLSETNNN